MENSPGILFWFLAVICVVSAVVTVSAKRAMIIGISLVVTILATMNLMILLDIIGLSFIYGVTSLVAVAAILFALKKSKTITIKLLEILSHPKPLFYFVISFLFYIGCLILISYTKVWQYNSEFKSISFFDLLTTLNEKYLVPFILAKSFMFLLLIIFFFSHRKRTV